MLRSEQVAGPAGELEALHRIPEQGRVPVAAALLCHPHPLHGGTMHSRVVFHVARALQDIGIATLRFNFRGVGRSAGRHDDGRGEVEDARAALGHLERLHPGLPLVVAGHSFGAWVGLRAGLDDARVARLVGVGVPLRYYEFDFLAAARPRVLLIQGEEDAFGSGADIIRLDASLGPRVETVVVPGADHFFTRHLDVLRALIQDRIPPVRLDPAS